MFKFEQNHRSSLCVCVCRSRGWHKHSFLSVSVEKLTCREVFVFFFYMMQQLQQLLSADVKCPTESLTVNDDLNRKETVKNTKR